MYIKGIHTKWSLYLAEHTECISQGASNGACPLCIKGKCVMTEQGPKCQCEPLYEGEHCDHYR